MAYRLEGKDIVIDGFDKGIADSPYQGIADMRNMQPVSVPNEASVQFSMTGVTQPPVYNNTAFTASDSTNRFTVASVAGLYEGVALSVSFSNSISYLVVAGGGGGAGGANTGGNAGSPGGGGGAGGMKTGSLSNLAAGAYTITIGAGGAKGVGGATGTDGTTGNDSSIAALVVSKGGGGGGGGGSAGSAGGNNGGSGGGAGFGNDSSTHTGGTATPVGQGNNGGDSGSGGANVNSGGGGGGGAVGANGSGTTSGNGGTGLASSISGTSITYAGGGGGGAINTGGSTGIGGTGGTGGGGTGAPTGAPGAGTANRGGGGGGGRGDDDGTNTDGANGGSGIVILSYPTGTVTATGGTITTSGGNTIHTFTTSGTFTVLTSGLTTDTVYYVRNISGSTFQLSATPVGTILDLTSDSLGTFTTYQYGNQRGLGNAIAPISYFIDRVGIWGSGGGAEGFNATYIVDASAYVWMNLVVTDGTNPANSLIFLGNIGGIAASANNRSGIAIWNGYLLLFGGTGKIDYASMGDLLNSGPLSAWSYGWKSPSLQSLNLRVPVLISQEDGNIYFGTSTGLGSIIETPGADFDPTNAATYTYTTDALSFPESDEITCMAELGQTLLLGGRRNFVYVWDKLSPGFNDLLNVPDNFTYAIVAMNNNAYMFSGVRGRIYITNGSGVEPYQKVPDYVTGLVNPYIIWNDANFDRNQLYFSFVAQTNSLSVANTVSGAWAINTDTKAFYLINKTTNTGYTGTTRMVAPVPPLDNSGSNPPLGNGLLIGWYSGSTCGVDRGSSDPYSNYESYLHTEIIPVGTYLDPFSPSQVEWKVSAPLVSGEAVRISYRLNLTDSFTVIGTTTYNGTNTTGTSTGVTAGAPVSDYFQANFQKAQWVQFLVETKSTATTPSFTRLTEMRIRDFPSGKST